MDNLTAQNNRLNQVLKEIQHPTITIDKAKDLYDEGSNISSNIIKYIEGLRRDAYSYTVE